MCLTRVTQQTRRLRRLFTMPAAAGLAVVLAGCGLVPNPLDREPPAEPARPVGDWPVPASNEAVLGSFQQVEAQAPAGPIVITSGAGVFRVIFWEGDSRAVYLQPRQAEWYGSRGLYHPGDFDHWQPHGGITRAFIEEGVRDFATREDAVEWLENHRPRLVWTPDGLAVGWEKRVVQKQLLVNLWQVRIDGQKPADLPGSLDAAIRLKNVPEFQAPPPGEL